MKYDDLSLEELTKEHERWKRRYRRWRILVDICSIVATIGLVIFVILFMLNDYGG